MVCPNDLPFRARHFSAGVADRAVSHARRHILRGAFLHVARADRAEVRHYPRARARNVPRVRATARARLVALFHMAPFQADTAQCYSRSRTFAHHGEGWLER